MCNSFLGLGCIPGKLWRDWIHTVQRLTSKPIYARIKQFGRCSSKLLHLAEALVSRLLCVCRISRSRLLLHKFSNPKPDSGTRMLGWLWLTWDLCRYLKLLSGYPGPSSLDKMYPLTDFAWDMDGLHREEQVRGEVLYIARLTTLIRLSLDSPAKHCLYPLGYLPLIQELNFGRVLADERLGSFPDGAFPALEWVGISMDYCSSWAGRMLRYGARDPKVRAKLVKGSTYLEWKSL